MLKILKSIDIKYKINKRIRFKEHIQRVEMYYNIGSKNTIDLLGGCKE